MKISMIVAYDFGRVIGKRGAKTLWHLPADLERFKNLTIGHAIIMGRQTHETIGRPLPGRLNVVLSENAGYAALGCLVVSSIDEVLVAVTRDEEPFVIGGGTVYEEFLPYASRLYVTEVHHLFDGDVFFPRIDARDWREVSREDHAPDEKNQYTYSFVIYERINMPRQV